MIRVVLPSNLRILANANRVVEIQIEDPVTLGSILDRLEALYPALLGTIRDQNTKERRAFIRFFACEQDLSHEELDFLLPDAVANGTERFFVVGAMSGG